MTVALWIVSILLAVAFLFAGTFKLTQPKEKLAAKGMAYVEDFSQTQVRLIGAFLGAGAFKLTQPKEKLAAKGMAYVEDFSQTQVRLIGAAEVLGAIGLIVPQATGVLTWLTPAAAIGLALLMIGAVLTHVRRKEPQVIPANTILFALAAFVAIGLIAG